MKKSLLLLVSAVIAYTSADAAMVSADCAKAIARGILPGTDLVESPRSRSEVDAQPYYVFNAVGEKGFVIVAADDRLPQVLGYSHEGELNLKNAPSQLLALLGMSAEVLEGLDEQGVSMTSSSSAGTPVVSPLLGDINWGQSDPFNSMCPVLSNGVRGYVGCVATAMSQIMRFYGYPAHGNGSFSYTDGGNKLSADFGSTTYEWDNMPAVVPESPTAAQVQAYSTLCSHLGIAVEMQYAPGGSGAYTMLVPRAMRDFFGYSRSIAMHSRSYYNSGEWMSMIKSELDKGRPVYYAASSEDGLGGHAFVCDGYDSSDYVHINWGWYGNSNGYFAINHLNPGELGEGGGSGAYNLSQEIITDFVPLEVSDGNNHIVYGGTRFSISSFGTDITLMSTVENLDTRRFDGKLMAVLTDTDDNIVCVLKEEPMSISGFSGGRGGIYWATMRDIPTTTPVAVGDGKYRLHYAYESDGVEPRVLRHPIGLPGYADCHVAGNKIVVDGQEVVKPSVKVKNLQADGDIYVNGSARFLAEVNNMSTNFRLSKIVLRLTSVDDPTLTCESSTAVNIYDMCEADVVMDIDMPASLTEGDYRVTMYHEGHDDAPFDIEETVVTLLPEQSVPVLRMVGSPVLNNVNTGDMTLLTRDDRVMFTLPLKNYAAAGPMKTIARLHPLDNSDAPDVVFGAIAQEWSKSETRSVVFSGVVRVDPGRYSISFSTLDAKGKECVIDDYDGEVTVVENENLALEVVSLDMPSRLKQGERVECSITVKSTTGYQGYVYVRVRQITYSDGELATMQNVTLQPGQEKTINFRYRPDSDMTDGLYLVMVETREGNGYPTAGGHINYYREIAMGDYSGDLGAVDEVVIDGINDDSTVEQWYDLQGRAINKPSRGGIYLRRRGSVAEKVYVPGY
ncbi:MAG: C10 family peptidase [Clostridiales bacterium]|nr:C10 family peptidase [Clostridiales bacterium]